MGYTTDFVGDFTVDIPLTKSQIYYLNKFSNIRHMRRDINLLPPDPILQIVGLPLSYEGEHFVGTSFCDNIPLWTPHTNRLFNDEFQQKVLLLLYIQKCNTSDINRDVFFTIIQYLSMNVWARDYNCGENLAYIDNTINRYFDIVPTSTLDHNRPPTTQPGLWCNWESNPDGTLIRWNGAEKFYEYIRWLQYIIDHFMIPWGRKLTGEITFQGEARRDAGTMHITDNILTTTYHTYNAKLYTSSDDEDEDGPYACILYHNISSNNSL